MAFWQAGVEVSVVVGELVRVEEIAKFELAEGCGYDWQTYIFITSLAMNRSNSRRCIRMAPFGLRSLICLLGVILQQVQKWTWNFLDLSWCIKQVHLVILVSYFIG